MTESVPNDYSSLRKVTLLFLVLVFLAAVGSVVYRFYQVNVANCTIKNSKASNPLEGCVKLEKLTTQEARATGLSGKTSIKNTEGMLFVFDTPGRQCMWMKDMNFNIDIIWVDVNNKVTKVERNISPKTFPKSFCGSSADAYVIETAPGVGSDEQLSIGNKLNL